MNRRAKPTHLHVVKTEEPLPVREIKVNAAGQQQVVVRAASPEPEVKSPRWQVYLSIMKPITWVPVVWSFLCGALVGLRFEWSSLLHLAVGLLLSGPLLCGMSQAINDYFDREVDALNEPQRAIPSHRITLMETYRVIGSLGFIGLLSAYYLGGTVFILSLLGIAMAHAYSAPPLRLKRFTWLGPITSASAYVMLPWLAAASIFGQIDLRTLLLTGLWTMGAMGIMVSNDFKSIVGDYALKLPSVPVVYGSRKAAIIVCVLIDLAQFVVAGYLLFGEGHWVSALVVTLLVLPQLYYQRGFLEKPLARAIWYNAHSQFFFVTGMLVSSTLLF
jgi:chlorophyll synthase